jgi:CHAT domain-containing protein
MAEHRPAEALRDFRTALGMAKRWRLEIVPAESVRMSAGVGLEQLYSSFIRAAGELFQETRQESLAREAFEAAEESRAVGLRAAAGRNANWYRRLPAEYGQTLAELRSARVELLRRQSPAESEHIRSLRQRLAEMEARAGDPVLAQGGDSSPELAGALPRVLGPSEAVISFHLDEPYSYSWVVTHEGLAFQRLAGASHLQRLIDEFREAVRNDSPNAAPLGERLYAELFAAAGAGLRSRTYWLLCVEDGLISLPFASLVVGRRSDRPVFLAERRTLAVLPGAGLLISARRAGAPADLEPGHFLGIGDAIYNVADQRASGSGGRGTSLQLPRLAGSAREVAACARAWEPDGAPALLEGATATREALTQALAAGPSVIHFATHFVESGDNPPRQLIQLSLLPGGDPDYLGAEEIATWRLRRPGIVVLSGCASGRPEADEPVYSLLASPPARLPRQEMRLVGLARAWLAAGASAVVVSLWPTPDDAGDLFRSFYRHLRQSGGSDVASALARAQVDTLESKTWCSVPRHWAAYSIVVGK